MTSRLVQKFRDRMGWQPPLRENNSAPWMETLESRVLLSADPLAEVLQDVHDFPDENQTVIHMPLLTGQDEGNAVSAFHENPLDDAVAEVEVEVAGKRVHDELGRVLRTTEGEETVNYEYDATGKVSRTWTGADAANPVTDVHNRYDAFGRLESVTTYVADGERLDTPEVISYRYNAAGDLVRVDQPDGSVTMYSYDGTGRLTAVRQYGPADAADDGATEKTLEEQVEYYYRLAIGDPSGEDAAPAGRLQSESFLEYDAQGHVSAMRINLYEDGILAKEVLQVYAYTASGIEVELVERVPGQADNRMSYVVGYDELAKHGAFGVAYSAEAPADRQLEDSYDVTAAHPAVRDEGIGPNSQAISLMSSMTSIYMLMAVGVYPGMQLQDMVGAQNGNGSLSVPNIIDTLLSYRHLATNAKLIPHHVYDLRDWQPVTLQIARQGALGVTNYRQFLLNHCDAEVTSWLNGKQIHHIVQQHPANVDMFKLPAIHSISNLYVLDT